jgi:ribonuclease HI
MQHVTIYSDGSARGNPGPGGYGAVLQFRDAAGELHEKELSQGYARTTNNRMELLGVIVGLEALKRPCVVEVITDSQYVANGINLGWAEGWKANNWRKKDKKPALNPELWDELLTEIAKHEVTIQWIKGHAGHPENERCDELAVLESQKFI